MVFYTGRSLLHTMPTPPKGYVVLTTSTTHTDLSKELQKWKTAKPSIPNQDGKFDIYVSEEEWETYKRELCNSTI